MNSRKHQFLLLALSLLATMAILTWISSVSRKTLWGDISANLMTDSSLLWKTRPSLNRLFRGEQLNTTEKGWRIIPQMSTLPQSPDLPRILFYDPQQHLDLE